ncbi:MAG: YiiG family protein [Burkholderiaceae bacterium]|nr:YiiG family protein [Burkholderiaceae bacterium]
MASCKRPGADRASDKPAAAQKSSGQTTEGTPSVLSAEKKEPDKAQPAFQKRHDLEIAYALLMDEKAGLVSVYDDLARRIAKPKKGGRFEFRTVGKMDEALKYLKQGESVSVPDMSDLDESVKTLAALCEQILTHEKNFAASPERPRGDWLAKARSIHGDYESAVGALSRLGNALMKYRRLDADGRMEKFKADSRTISYHTEEMMILSEELLAVFDQRPFVRSDAFSSADKIRSKLDAALRAQHKAIEESREKGSVVNAHFDEFRRDIEGIIQNYREVRDKKSESAFRGMQQKYDKATQDYNSANVAG